MTTPAERAAASRLAQGLPPTIEDPAIVARAAARLRHHNSSVAQTAPTSGATASADVGAVRGAAESTAASTPRDAAAKRRRHARAGTTDASAAPTAKSEGPPAVTEGPSEKPATGLRRRRTA